MRLVLLPGMDGTGELFSPLLQHIAVNTLVISLPQSGAQDYETLTAYVLSQLPDEEYVLLAESFSGPIGARVASLNSPLMKGVIFVATFLSPPNRKLLNLAKSLPLKSMTRIPVSSVVIRLLLLGWSSSRFMLSSFMNALDSVHEQVLKERINAIRRMGGCRLNTITPTLYIRASDDRLVSGDKWRKFSETCNDFSLVEVKGPHMILQGQAEECAEVINRFIDRCR